MCRGQHVPTRLPQGLQAHTRISGEYWRGDSKNEQLHRIYGTAWADEQAQGYIQRIEEAEKRDHRRIGKAQDPVPPAGRGAGLVFWHPKAGRSGRWSSSTCAASIADRYGEVRCPQIWRGAGKKSGQRTTTRTTCSSTESEKRTYALKPMNCLAHVQVFNQGLHSYRDCRSLRGIRRLPSQRPSGAADGSWRARLQTGRRPRSAPAASRG